MARGLLVALLLGLAPAVRAAPFVLVFEGTVSFTTGSAPSLANLGLSSGSPLHYEVLVDRDGDGFFLADGEVVPQPDVWNGPDDNQDHFYAELLAQPYATPGSYLDLGREFFLGVDDVSPAFPDCTVLGRLFVGTELFVIDGCAPVATWGTGFEVGSWHNWNDPITDESVSVFGSLTVTEIVEVPEPSAAGLLALGTALLAAGRYHRHARSHQPVRGRRAKGRSHVAQTAAPSPNS